MKNNRLLGAEILLVLLLCSHFSLGLLAQSPCDFTWVQAPNSLEVQFTSTYSGTGCIASQTWRFGDNNTSSDVSNPLHTYYYNCVGVPQATFNVIHSVVVLENGQAQTHSCTTTIVLNCPPNLSDCSDRYFNFDINGCTVVTNEDLDQLPPGWTSISWDFGDGSPSEPGLGAVHSYASPGTYYVTQNYNLAGGGSGSCTRAMTVGCCCDALTDVDIEFELECCDMTLNAHAQCEDADRCALWIVTVGSNPPVTIQSASIENYHITNYSTYGSNSQITVQHTVWCEGQAQTETFPVTPPFEGVFIGGVAGPSPPGGGGGNTCDVIFNNLSDYEAVLPGGSFNNNSTNGRKNVYVSGQSIIRVNKSFTFLESDIFMGPSSGWDVLPTRIFELTRRTNMEAGCCLWRGINVYGNGRFRSQNGLHPTDLNHIQDALFAVRPINQNGASPVISLRQTVFEDNFVSLRGTDGNFILSGSQNNPYFAKNQFISTGPLRCAECLLPEIEAFIQPLFIGVPYIPEKSFAGIWLEGGNGANALTNLTIFPTNDGEHNVFDAIYNGIYARDINLNVQDCASFLNILAMPDWIPTGIGINYWDRTGAHTLTQKGLVVNGSNPPQYNASSFDNCYRAVVTTADGGAAASTVNVRDNQMTNILQYGILSLGSGNTQGEAKHNLINSDATAIAYIDLFAGGASTFRIYDNTLTNAGIFSPFDCVIISGTQTDNQSSVEVDHNVISASGSHGIDAVSHNGLYIHENIITNVTAQNGIRAVVCRAEIECNDVTGTTGNGIYVLNSTIVNDLSFNNLSNTPTGIRIWGDCPADNLIKCNTFLNNGTGLQYVNSAMTGDQINTGNCWTGTGASADPTVNVLLSEYIMPLQQPACFPALVNPLFWFSQQMLPIPTCTKVCQAGLLPPGGGGGNQYDSDVAAGTLSVSDWAKWRRERYLLYKLAEYPALASGNTLMSDFQSAKANTTVGKMVEYGLQARELMALKPNDASALAANAQEMADKSAQIGQIDQSMDENLPLAQYDALLSQRAALNAEVAALTTQRQTLLGQVLATRSVEADALIALFAPVIVTQPFEQNEKTLLNIYLQTVAKGISPSTAQLETLKDIGEQCIDTGGPAVGGAVSFYHSVTGTTLIQDDCSGSGGRPGGERENAEQARAQKASTFSVSVFPNPAGDWLFLDIADGVGPYQMTVTDMLGSTLLQMSEMTPSPALDISQLREVIYTLLVRAADGKQVSRLFVKQ